MALNAFIFVPALVACVILGSLFAAYSAQHYMNVLQGTASGAKHIASPAEPLVDNLWKMVYMLWMIGLWLGPAWFLGLAFAKSDVPWMRYALPLAVFWLFYPFSQLSSLSGPSIWLPFHHDVFGRMARKPGVVLGFLFLSGLTLVLIGFGFHWTFIAEGLVYLAIGCPLLVVAALIYARLLGRLAFALMYTRSILSRKKKKKRTAGSPAAEQPENDPEPAFIQPSELPPIQTPDEGPLTGYDIRFEATPRKRVRAESTSVKEKPEPPRPPKHPMDDDEDQPYGVHEPEVKSEERAPAEIIKPSEMEMKLLNRDDAPRPPKQVWTPELMGFLFQPEMLSAIGLLTTLCLLFGGVVRIAREFNPVRGD